MGRFGVHANPDGRGYLLDVQADLLADYNTHVVVPLMPLDHSPTPAARLNPVFRLGNQEFVMLTQLLPAVPGSALGKPVATLEDRHTEIVGALDFLLQGF